jgi:hypothetical protein
MPDQIVSSLSEEPLDFGKEERARQLSNIPTEAIEYELRRRQREWERLQEAHTANNAVWDRAWRQFEINRAHYQREQERLANAEPEPNEFFKWLLRRVGAGARV